MAEPVPLVFISASSDDYELAGKVHDFLCRHGVPVFFATRSLPELGDSDYRRVIDAKLDECVHMIVVTSSRSRVESPWVEAEWGFFINARRAGAKLGNIITVTAGGLDPLQLPPSLRYHEVVPFAEDRLHLLLRYVTPFAAPVADPSAAPAVGPAAAEALRGAKGDAGAFEAWSVGARIRVFGVGRGGQQVIDLMFDLPAEGVTRVVVSTDARTLEACRADVRLLIGEGSLRGLGAGGDPGTARAVAEAELPKLERELEGCDLVVLAAGLGGGTGTGVAPVLARVARNRGIMTVGVVTLPFRFEGARRARLAQEALEELIGTCDIVVPLPGDEAMTGLAPAPPVTRAFEHLSTLSARCLHALAGLFQNRGLVNLDFADLHAVLKDSGVAAMGQGEASGPGRAEAAARLAMTSGYLSPYPLGRAQVVAMLVEAGRDLRLDEIARATDVVSAVLDAEANLIFGSELDDALGGVLRATIIATRFPKTTA